MQYKVYCLGKCGIVIAMGEINAKKLNFIRPTTGWCDWCSAKRHANKGKATGEKG